MRVNQDIAQFGRVLGLELSGRRFESYYPDQFNALLMELVDMSVLETDAGRRVGSIPT